MRVHLYSLFGGKPQNNLEKYPHDGERETVFPQIHKSAIEDMTCEEVAQADENIAHVCKVDRAVVIIEKCGVRKTTPYVTPNRNILYFCRH